MNARPALQWFRARQRDLTKVVLALFCLAWLQAGAVPCAMADQVAAQPAAHCPYCPQGSSDAGTGHDNCVFPHEPQLDSRIASGLFFVVPVATLIATLETRAPEAVIAAPQAPPPDSGAPLLASFCRYLL